MQPPLVAQQLLSKMYIFSLFVDIVITANSTHSTDEFISKHPHSEYANTNLPERSLSFPQLADYIRKYQDPSQADSIMKIQQELDQTKIVLYVLLPKGWEMLADVNIVTKLLSLCWSEVRSLHQLCVV